MPTRTGGEKLRHTDTVSAGRRNVNGQQRATGMRTREILNAFPDLENEDVKEALRFAADAGRRWRLTEILIR